MARQNEYEAQGGMSTLTNLVQLVSSDPQTATQLLSETCEFGVPVLVVLENQPSCCYFKLDVP